MNDRVILTIYGRVAGRPNCPERMNALDPAMFAALVDVSSPLRSYASLRTVVCYVAMAVHFVRGA